MMKQSRGFTVIELLIVIVLLGTATIIFFAQKNGIETGARDNERKVAINAMYYSLEEVFYAKNGYYPATLDATTLPSIDPDLFIDPSNNRIGESASTYRYEPTNCVDNKCAGYTIRTTLENEADFVKNSRH